MKILQSKEDASINIVHNGFETRFVQRSDDYFIIYLSSQKGCQHNCRMCHLTATGQTNSEYASVSDFVVQVDKILYELKLQNKDFSNITKVHFNFMARGDILGNTHLPNVWDTISVSIADTIQRFFMENGTQYLQVPKVEFIISTIFPELNFGNNNFRSRLKETGTHYANVLMSFAHSKYPPRIYYSMYSVNEDVRKKWLPKSVGYDYALRFLVAYENLLSISFKKVVNKIHHAFIKGVNDSEEEAYNLMATLEKPEFTKIKNIAFNIVRYNPYDERYGEEADIETINKIVQIYKSHGHQVDIIPRVGRDVKASCGMFVESTD
ncbi:MAG: hypothetical protein WC967_13180 [Balneolaceae bacterium]